MKLPYMPFYPADYLKDTRGLPAFVKGVWMDMICYLWDAPNRGSDTLPLSSWAQRCGVNEMDMDLAATTLEMNRVCTILRKPDAVLTVICRRMVRDEKARKSHRKRQAKYDAKRQADAKTDAPLRKPDRDISEVRSQKSESEVRNQNQKSETQKDRKRVRADKMSDALPVSDSSLVWTSYSEAYRSRYGVDPVRNAKVNSQLKALVGRLGQEAPAVCTFYLTHNRALYVQARHDVGLLLRDAEALRTQWATGTVATHGEAINAERRDEVQSQVERVTTMLNRRPT